MFNSAVYLIGGYTGNGSNSSNNYRYNSSADSWAAVSGLPGRARQSVATFMINNSAYTVGGYDGYASQTINTVSEFSSCDNITGILPVTGSSNKAGMEIYPNPSTNEVNVKIDDEVTSEIKYLVTSADGKLVKTGATQQSAFGFSASNLAEGVYILTITDSQGYHASQRFEVIH